MAKRVKRRKHGETGNVYEYRSSAFYVPNGAMENKTKSLIRNEGGHDGDESELEQRNIIKFDTLDAALLWDQLMDSVPKYEVKQYRPNFELCTAVMDEADIVIPVAFARQGTAKMAAYLKACGMRNSTIANRLDVSESTVGQYLSDVKRGER